MGLGSVLGTAVVFQMHAGDNCRLSRFKHNTAASVGILRMRSRPRLFLASHWGICVNKYEFVLQIYIALSCRKFRLPQTNPRDAT